MNRIKRIYEMLLKDYGPQGWWPITPTNSNVPEYREKIVDDKQRFEVIVGAILTQNTSWKNVEKAIVELNKKNLLSIRKLKKTNVKVLAKLIKSAGYFNQKAERLKTIADFFSNHPISGFFKDTSESLEDVRERLLSAKGIGPETADSILLYAFNKPIFVIDAYTKRIFSRLFESIKEDIKYEDLQKLFMQSLVYEKNKAKLFNEYHALLVEHAKIFCKKKPECKECPLKQDCDFGMSKKRKN